MQATDSMFNWPVSATVKTKLNELAATYQVVEPKVFDLDKDRHRIQVTDPACWEKTIVGKVVEVHFEIKHTFFKAQNGQLPYHTFNAQVVQVAVLGDAAAAARTAYDRSTGFYSPSANIPDASAFIMEQAASIASVTTHDTKDTSPAQTSVSTVLNTNTVGPAVSSQPLTTTSQTPSPFASSLLPPNYPPFWSNVGTPFRLDSRQLQSPPITLYGSPAQLPPLPDPLAPASTAAATTRSVTTVPTSEPLVEQPADQVRGETPAAPEELSVPSNEEGNGETQLKRRFGRRYRLQRER